MFSRDLITYYVGKVIPSITSLLIIVLGVRWLGEAGYGVFNLLYNAAMISSTLCMGWLQQSSLRFIPGKSIGNADLIHQYYGFGQWAASAAMILTFSIAIIYFQLQVWDSITAGLFAALWTLLSVHLTILQARFSSLNYAKTESVYNLIILITLFILLAIGASATPISFVWIFCLSAFSTLVISFFQKQLTFSDKRIVKESFLQAFRFGFPLTIWLLISNLFNLTDRYLINYFLGDSETGMYASVYDLIYKLAALGCFPILLSKHPAIVEAWNTHAIHDAVRIIKKSLFLEAFVLLFMLAGGILIGEWLIHALLEITVPDYYLISIPLIVSSVLWQMALLIHKPLEMKHKTARMITYILLSLALNFLLNVLFIPRFGVTASAFSTLISTFFYAGLSALTASKLIKSTK